MTYTSLMVHLELGQSNAALLKIAGDLAKRFSARVIGIAGCRPIQIAYSDGFYAGDIIEQDRLEIDREINQAEAEFRAALEPYDGPVEWRSAVTFDLLPDYLTREARGADLFITKAASARPLFDASRHVDTGDLIMRMGRPVLLVPDAAAALELDHVVVGWKDTAETRRAIADALPILQAAARVTIVEIAAEEALAESRARLNDVAAWLGRHGVRPELLVSPSTQDEAAQLAALVENLKADLVVAGAYGHSRVREWAFGGVTRDFLLRANRCSLVSH